MIAAVGQALASSGREPRCFAAQLEFSFEYRLHQRFGSRIGSVEYRQSVAAEQGVKPAAERLGQAGARGVRSTQTLQRHVGELCWRQRLAQFGEQLADRGGQAHGGHGRARWRRCGQVEPLQLELPIQHGTGADLVQVVVLGVHPENGHGAHAVFGFDAARQRDGGKGLEQRKKAGRRTVRPAAR